MKVVVTGAGGMLGTALVPALEAVGHEVLPLTEQDADVRDLTALRYPLTAFHPDWVVNLAAYTRVDDAETHADAAYLVNALGARNVALAAAESGAAVLHLSTDYVFAGDTRSPRREYDAAVPRTVYGVSKRAGELAVAEVHARHLIVRTAWLYGRGGHNFVDTILRKSRAGESIAVVDDQHGSPTWTRDLAAQLIRLMASSQFGTYHVTSSGECSWHEFASHLLALAGLPPPSRTDSAAFARPAPRPAYSVLSNLLAEYVTGRRMPTWQDAIERYLQESRSS
jgi:dTDP-4-dehydrorhamnose reductase